MKIWILIIVTVNQSLGTTKIDMDVSTFKTAEKCLRVRIALQEELKKKYDTVYVDCRERELQ